MFTVGKATAGRVPDLITREIDKDDIAVGKLFNPALTLFVSGTSTPAYICMSKYDAALYPNGPNSSDKVEALLMPLDEQTMIEVTVATPHADIVPGFRADVLAGALTISNASTNDDFLVERVISKTSAGLASKVAGFLVKASGYYA